ncbi:acetyltransferase (GNAT) family protein [Micromonospora pisi]|uniref:Acetyltransferase (GNAT) family protein n=1 Tax=Micromonospora pisi TaxID=589240 RepID=A0A495JFT4_9ACTN|nr:GNAT family N-acetyltransferase [Micromonospora pisi]RKR87753.1 acetyltransferase (GNAT) family protein [Micromonospora pisi]
MLIESRPCSDPELVALVSAQQRELREANRPLASVGASFPTRDDVSYLVGVVSGRAVACGAIRSIDRTTAEIARMYVRPAYRRRGIGRQLLDALEELAYQAGHSVLRLETGTYPPSAIALYRSSGYTEIPVYGEHVGNPQSACFGKRILISA